VNVLVFGSSGLHEYMRFVCETLRLASIGDAFYVSAKSMLTSTPSEVTAVFRGVMFFLLISDKLGFRLGAEPPV
jgi:hypothetical protein